METSIICACKSQTKLILSEPNTLTSNPTNIGPALVSCIPSTLVKGCYNSQVDRVAVHCCAVKGDDKMSQFIAH